jgi:hypothetical protein
MQLSVMTQMKEDHQLRVWEPSAGDELDVPGSGALLVTTDTDLDGKRTFLDPPVPK